MENILIWGITFFLILIIVLPYFIKHRKQQRKDSLRKKEAQRLGADKAIAQHPQINDLLCIGCGSCVDACPEGDVLGIVSGRAAIINGLKCVGHGKCQEACPVGAITIGLGDLSGRDDIPYLSDSKETNIAGVYIAGELGGLALIKNAIAQGKEIVETIAKKQKNSSNNDDILDLLIVGAGPAGTSAALEAINKDLSFILIDQQDAGGTILQYPRKKLVMTKPVSMPLYGTLSKPEYSKEELLEIWKDLRQKFDRRLHIQEKFQNLISKDGLLEVETNKKSYKAFNVILALGRRGTPRKLGVPGEDQSKVMYKLMDAESYQDNNILVVGGGDSAIEAAIGLSRQKGNKVTLSYRKDKFFRIKTMNEKRLQEAVEQEQILLILSSGVVEILEKAVILSKENETITLENDYVFIFAGGEPPFKLLKDIGIQFGK